MKKKSILLIIGLLILTLLVACSSPQNPVDEKTNGDNTSTENVTEDVKVLNIGATPVPHAEILEFIKPLLLEEGIQLKITEFTDYVTPNLALTDGDIDGNFFQHAPYMESFAEDHGLDLKAVAKTHVEPLGLYSKKITDIKDLKEGSKIAIPNDPTNGGRALILLEYHGLIELAEDAPLTATEKDITSNPNNFEFIPLDAPQLPRSLDDVDAAIINTNYALEADLNPVRDALIIEDANSPYANILAVLTKNENDPLIQSLIKVLNSPETKEFIETKYEGAIVPAF